MYSRTVVLLLTAFVLTACTSRSGPSGTGSGATGPTTSSSSATTATEAQLRDADPCGFLDNPTLSAYGTLDFEDGVFYTDCTASIAAPGNALRVQASLQLEKSGRDAGDPWKESERRGFTVWTAGEESFGCQREIQAYDDVVVALWASESETSGTICDLADKATDAAIEQLLSGEIAPHEVPASSLFNQDACALVTDVDAARAPEIDATDVHPAFAGQFCTWGVEDITQPSLFVSFTRYEPPVADEPGEQQVPVAGHTAVVTQEERDAVPGIGASLPSCEVEVVYDTDLDGKAEILTVSIRNNGTPAANCPLATELATTAMGQLPGA